MKMKMAHADVGFLFVLEIFFFFFFSPLEMNITVDSLTTLCIYTREYDSTLQYDSFAV